MCQNLALTAFYVPESGLGCLIFAGGVPVDNAEAPEGNAHDVVHDHVAAPDRRVLHHQDQVVDQIPHLPWGGEGTLQTFA